MTNLRSVHLLLSLMLFHATCSSAVAQQTVQPGVVQTNKTRFRIPFSFNQTALGAFKPVNVLLYVSRNRGKNWKQVASANPKDGSVQFSSSGDGEYWFSVRAVDSDGRNYPPTKTHQPSLKIRVDSTAPKSEMKLTRLDSTTVEIDWTIDNRDGDLKLMRIEATSPDSSRWEPLDFTPSTKGEVVKEFFRSGVVKVRFQVADMAGNEAVVEKTIDLRSGSVTPMPTSDSVAAYDLPTAGRRTVPVLPVVQSTVLGPATDVVRTENVSPTNPALGLPTPAVGLQTPTDASGELRPLMPVNTTLAPVTQPRPTRRLVNTHSFRINYKLDDIGPSGVSQVDFFVTEDGGKKWWKYGRDPDRQSPFMIKVPSDGVYGFAIRAQSGAGLTELPPQPSEKPDVVVEVDSAKPTLKMMPLEPVTVAGSRILKVRWTAEDANLGDQPIGLYYSRSKRGPWESVSGWVANSGEYQWSVGREVPTQVFLRIAARDKAGNVSQLDTSRPVVVDTARPSARITHIDASPMR